MCAALFALTTYALLGRLLVSGGRLPHLLRSSPLREADRRGFPRDLPDVIDREFLWQLREKHVRLRWALAAGLRLSGNRLPACRSPRLP
jgi:hypothetical protein